MLKRREKRMTTRRSRTHRVALAMAGARKDGVLKSFMVARRRACDAVALGRGMLASSVARVKAGVGGALSDILSMARYVM